MGTARKEAVCGRRGRKADERRGDLEGSVRQPKSMVVDGFLQLHLLPRILRLKTESGLL